MGFETLSAFNSSDGSNFLFSSFTISLYPSCLTIVYISLLNFCFPLSIFSFSLIFLLYPHLEMVLIHKWLDCVLCHLNV